MQVKCIKLVDKSTELPVDRNDWLTVGKTYRVIFIEKPKDGESLYRLISDDISKKPVLFDSSLFEVLEGTDDSWVSEVTQNGTYRCGPIEFMTPGFWANLFDGEPHEISVLKQVVGLVS